MNRFLSLLAGCFAPGLALACATCGVSQSLTPKTLAIGSGFVVLPFTFAGFIAWKVWKQSKPSK